jgi:hypothetical protein
MRVHVFFSVHEPMFHAIVRELMADGIVSELSGFVWGEQQVDTLLKAGAPHSDPLIVFSRDVLPQIKPRPNHAWLRQREQLYGESLNKILLAERHLLADRTFDERLALLEALLRTIEGALEGAKRPDVILTEDVACMTSYLYWLVARHNKIPFLALGQGKLGQTCVVYGNERQRWDRTDEIFEQLRRASLTSLQRSRASEYLARFREKPEKPPSAVVFDKLPTVDLFELGRFGRLVRNYARDAGNPTIKHPIKALRGRARRWKNAVRANQLFEAPVPDEPFVLFPLQFQPEASTLVRGILYENQIALVEDLAKSLPIGVRLYVKEHYASQGRRDSSYYEALKRIHGVRLISHAVSTHHLIQRASAIATVSSTMGFEGLLWEKPVFTFGEVFYNAFPLVQRAGLLPKDQWYHLISATLAAPPADRELLLTYIAAIQLSVRPGFKANPVTFPEVMRAENIRNLADAVSAELTRRVPQRPAPSAAHDGTTSS